MKTLITIVVLALTLTTAAFARDLPAYYPADELRRAGTIDDVNLAENRIVINDIPYRFSDDALIHSVHAYSVSKTRLRPGTLVAFKVGSGQSITTFWLLPRNFDVRGSR